MLASCRLRLSLNLAPLGIALLSLQCCAVRTEEPAGHRLSQRYSTARTDLAAWAEARNADLGADIQAAVAGDGAAFHRLFCLSDGSDSAVSGSLELLYAQLLCCVGDQTFAVHLAREPELRRAVVRALVRGWLCDVEIELLFPSTFHPE